ncbi:hypothetical protein FOIG_10684 [Fusarium odoratissimum NRRL 54006]|uniref:Uncharacterized protein n=2 Tax=Fusarium oxysporum species complex TaxID=171631 RepID=X0JKS8_FUSO5|nr:uncharacterized protein FOIG_10684 [Fusarium odoratissimum NRRL 54006]EXL96925.1 hypothetical protein FOIG_10684 [Fusarium odoratissimum NRRL 54006]TXC00500.1 hypothetical protein FocTR4_00008904 [Fusarium oxysporum f. sp. cubense]
MAANTALQLVGPRQLITPAGHTRSDLPSLASHSLGSSKPVVPTFSLSLHAPQHVRF